MANPTDPKPRQPDGPPADQGLYPDDQGLSPVETHEADRVEARRADEPFARQDERRGTIMGEEAAARDPDTGAVGTTNPRAAAPMGSSGPTGVAPPKRGEAKWLAIAGIGVVGVILILLILV